MKSRRVGTFTMGMALVFAGILSVLSLFTNIVDIFTVIKLSPLILVFLGVEILLYSFKEDEYNIKYDGFALFISFVLIMGTLAVTAAVALIDKYHLPIYYN